MCVLTRRTSVRGLTGPVYPDDMNLFCTILLFAGKFIFFKLFVCKDLRGFALFFLFDFRMKCAGLCKGGEERCSNPKF